MILGICSLRNQQKSPKPFEDEHPAVPAGEYVFLYDTRGKTDIKKETINVLIINYKLGPPMEFGSMMTKEFYNTFGGGKEVIVNKGTVANLLNGEISSLNG